MNIQTKYFSVLILVLIFFSAKSLAQNNDSKQHPKLILTSEGVSEIKSKLGTIPLFDNALQEAKTEVDAEIASGIDVPVPKDYSGGYTHERHKRNFLVMQKAGVLFQILGDEKYAVYVKNMLLQYAELYPKLSVHPQTRSYARGKIFWQCLNDANWLVYASQAYDCIYNFLSENERQNLEKNLFRPFADFISIENPQYFNRVHNHSTWGVSAVGMIALVMDDRELLERALYGIKNAKIPEGMKDNDGGLIIKPGQKAGFFANIDEPFSPDGYYTEGPYYQRYAMYPFLIFAEALQNTKPEYKIFEYKNGVLLKAVDALLNLSDKDGKFFPLNDAQKGMSYYSRELLTSVDIAYHFGNQNPGLLDVAQKQGSVTLDDCGLSVALGAKNGKAKPYSKKSVELRDGQNGDEGGVGILRKNNLELVFKYTSQGLSHGHYDKLSFSFYNNGKEVLQDYGLARFVNIEQKGGGNYLKENSTWAKQTIAHNTLVQNETSHFGGNYETGSKFHSDRYLFDAENENLQVTSAIEKNAYPGTEIHRTLALISDSEFENPIVLDIVKVSSNTPNQYDLPFYYLGQFLKANFKYETPKTLSQLGNANGFQHLYKEGYWVSDGTNASFDWLSDNTFYTLTTSTSKNDELILARIGANDPDFNLRRESAFIIRKKDQKDALFVSVLETHGSYSPVSELTKNPFGNLKNLEIAYQDSDYTAVKWTTKNDHSKLFLMCQSDSSKTKKHTVTIGGKKFSWKGAFSLQSIN
ncbi:MAG: alginate lyase family protein [Bergeyella sp.]